MPFAMAGAGLGAVGSIVGGGKQAGAIKSAANDQLSAALQAQAIQQGEFGTIQSNIAPYLHAGDIGLRDITTSLPSLTANFKGAAPFDGGSPFHFDPASVAKDPAYQFALSQGQQAINQSANANGMAGSGATMKALDQFATGTASQYENQDYNQALQGYQTNYQNAQQAYNLNYANAFQAFRSNQDNAFSKLASLASIGEGGNGQVNQAGQNYANNASSIAQSAGNAMSAGAIGAGNAQAGMWGGLSSSLSGLLNNPSFQSMMRNSFGGGSGGGGGISDSSGSYMGE